LSPSFGERCAIVRAQDFDGDTMDAIPVDAVSKAVAQVIATVAG
jgi:hypothetical protein